MVKNHNPKNEMQDMLTPLDAEEAAKTKLRLDMRERFLSLQLNQNIFI